MNVSKTSVIRLILPCIPTTAAAGVIFAAFAMLLIFAWRLFWDCAGVRAFLDGGADTTKVVDGGCMDI
jgi:hypothetical protein